MTMSSIRYRIDIMTIALLSFLIIRPTELDLFAWLPLPPTTVLTLSLFLLQAITNSHRMLTDDRWSLIMVAISALLIIIDAAVTVVNKGGLSELFLIAPTQLLALFLYLSALSTAIGRCEGKLRIHIWLVFFWGLLLAISVLFQDSSGYFITNERTNRYNYLFTPFGMDKNTYAFICAVSGFFGLFVFLVNKSRFRILVLPLALYCLGAGIVVGSRTASIFIAIFGSAFLLLSNCKICYLFIFTIVIGLLFSDYRIDASFLTGSAWDMSSDGSDEGRLTSALNSIKMIGDSFLLGSGFENAANANYELGLTFIEHNQVLLFTNAYGIFFIFPFILFFIRPLRIAFLSNQLLIMFGMGLMIISWTTTPFMGFFSMIQFYILCIKAKQIQPIP